LNSRRVSSGREESGWMEVTGLEWVCSWPSFWYKGSVRDVRGEVMAENVWGFDIVMVRIWC
jgi:hypothetical protein